jgi:hypothetical protein
MKNIILLLLLLASFLVTYAQESPNPGFNVVLTVKRQIPYCGGAAPSAEMEHKCETEIKSDFIIQYQQGYGNSTWLKKLKTDSLGIIRCNLPYGKYCLKRADMNMAFEDFYKMPKKEDDKYNVYRDRTCYYSWWKSCILTFELNKENKSVITEVLINSRCYVGEDPCHNYIGPRPP